MRKYTWLAIIVLIAAFLRFWQVTQVPPALNSDEVAIGYNAYSVLTTGKDEYNMRLPVLFRSFDDYKMPLYVYLVAGSMKLFGYGDFAVRFPSALFGTLTVLCTYFLVMELFRKKEIALVASFFLAISPWSLQFSRAGYEANVAVFFIVFGTYLFLKERYILSSFVLSLSIWTYLTPRLFVPLLVVGLAVVYRQTLLKHKGRVLIALAVAVLMLLPIVQMTLSPAGQMRASGVSAFANPDIIKQSTLRLARDSGVVRIFDNRRIVYALTFLRGYFSHFDPNFLFLDKSIAKYHAPDVGLLYFFELPFLLVGAYMLVRRWSKSSALTFWWLLMAFLFLGTVPHLVSTTKGDFSTHLALMFPFFIILIGIGMVEVSRKIPWVIIIALYLLNVVGFVSVYVYQYPLTGSGNFPLRVLSRYMYLTKQKRIPLTIYSGKKEDVLNNYVFYTNGVVQNTNTSKPFTYDDIHFTNCDTNIKTVDTTKTAIYDSACDMTIPGKAYISRLYDGGHVFTIVNDHLCSNVKLHSFPTGIGFSELNVEALSTTRFCQTFISN